MQPEGASAQRPLPAPSTGVPPDRVARALAFGAGLYACVGGLVSLLGWIVDVPRLADWNNDGIATQPNTALASFAAGLAIVAVCSGARRVGLALGALAGAIGAATLLEHLARLDLGIDALLLWGRPWGSRGTMAPGRIGPPASICLTLTGSALILRELGVRGRRATAALGLTVAAVAFLSIVGYVFGADTLYSLPHATAIASQTASFLLAIAIGLVALVPDREPMRTLLERSGAGAMARHVVPFLLIAPIVIGYVVLQGERARLYDTPMGTGLFVVALIGASFAAFWNGARAASAGERALAAEMDARSRADEALREADRKKDEFLATLAHELRNPLAALANATELLGHVGDDGASRERLRASMKRQLSHVTRLVDDLLDVNRIEHGKLELKRERVDLAAALHAAADACQAVTGPLRHELRFSFPDRPIALEADPVRLEQLFVNLFVNAFKYTREGGRVDVTVTRDGGDAVVSVRDQGEGIPPEMLSSIFDLFTQVKTGQDRVPGGLGIGLALVKRLVELHGGSVLARSDGPGHGSEFVVRLPAAAPVAAADAGPEPPGETPRLHGRRVLVVDDNHDAAESLDMLLRLFGADSRVAADGPQALATAAAFRPDVVLLDIGLPGMSGLEVCRAMRREPWSAGVLLVALTGWGNEDDRERSRAAGFDRHLVKPVSPEQLVDAISAPAARDARSPDPASGAPR